MDWLDDDIVLNQALPHIRPVLERHYNDLKMSLTVLELFEMIMGKLDKQHLVIHVVPSILIMKLNEPTVMERFVSEYNRVLLYPISVLQYIGCPKKRLDLHLFLFLSATKAFPGGYRCQDYILRHILLR